MSTHLAKKRTMADIARDLRELIWEANENYGEVSEKMIAQWDALDEAFETKAQNTVLFIEELEASSKMYKERAKRISGHAKTLENTAKRLREMMIYFMKRTGKEKCPTELFPKLSVRQNPKSVEIVDEAAIWAKADEYLDLGYLQEQKPKISKSDIKFALQVGKTVDGAQLIRKEKLYW